jgi:hypothetical protein
MAFDWRGWVLADAAKSWRMRRETALDARMVGAELRFAFFTGVAVVWIHCRL